MAKIASAGAGSSDGGNSVTTAAIDTTGATELVVAVASQAVIQPVPTVTDSKGNTWVPRTTQDPGGNAMLTLFDAVHPVIVGSGHTFTATESGSAPHIWAGAFDDTDEFDDENGNVTTGDVELLTGSVTPAEAASLVVTAIGIVDATGLAIDSGMTLDYAASFTGGQHYGLGVAYKLSQTGAINPKWTWTNSGYGAASQSVFKPAGAPPPPSEPFGVHAPYPGMYPFPRRR